MKKCKFQIKFSDSRCGSVPSCLTRFILPLEEPGDSSAERNLLIMRSRKLYSYKPKSTLLGEKKHFYAHRAKSIFLRRANYTHRAKSTVSHSKSRSCGADIAPKSSLLRGDREYAPKWNALHTDFHIDASPPYGDIVLRELNFSEGILVGGKPISWTLLGLLTESVDFNEFAWWL